MLFKMTELKYQPNPVLARALDVLFILHADHEQNCSTTTMRTIGSSHVDPYSAMAGAAAALYGPLHGGANEAVLRMLNEIGSVGKVPEFIKKVKSGEAGNRLMGFGHRVYKSYDPRAKVDQADRRHRVHRHRQEPAARDRAGARADRAAGRLLRHAQAVPERRLLLRPDLPGDGLPGRDVPGAVRHPAHRRLDRAVGRDAARSGAEDRAAAPDLHRARRSATTSRGTSAHDCALARLRSCSALQAATPAPARSSTRGARGSICGSSSRSARGPSGSPAIEQTRKYIKEQLARRGPDRHRAGVGRPDADRQGPDGEPHRHDSRRAQGADRLRRPLRHEAVSRSSGSSAPATADRARRFCSSSRAC